MLISLSCSQSQAHDKCDLSLTNLGKLLPDIFSRDLYFTLLLGDFNAKSKTSYINNQHTIEGTQF